MNQPIQFNTPQEIHWFTVSSLQTLNDLAKVYEEINKLLGVWHTRNLTGRNADEFVQIPKEDMQNLIYLFDSLKKYLEGEEAPTADFTQTINKLRSDL